MNPYEPPQSPLEHEPEAKPQLASVDKPWDKILLLKLGVCCVLILCEIYLAIVFLDLGLVALGIYSSPLIPGSEHLKPQYLVYCLLANSILIDWVWRSMD